MLKTSISVFTMYHIVQGLDFQLKQITFTDREHPSISACSHSLCLINRSFKNHLELLGEHQNIPINISLMHLIHINIRFVCRKVGKHSVQNGSASSSQNWFFYLVVHVNLLPLVAATTHLQAQQ